MIRLVGAEIRKLVRPLAVMAAVVAILLCLVWTAIVREAASQNLQAAESGVRYALQNPTPCKGFNLPPGPRCDRAKERERENAIAWLRSTRLGAAQARAVSSGFGAARLVSGLLGTAIGALVVILLGATSAGGEWTGRTIVPLVLQDGRRTRLLVAKIVGVWCVALIIFAAAWVGVGTLAPLFMGPLWPLPGDPAAASALPVLLGSVARTAVVLLVYAAIGVASGTLTRTPIGGVLAASGGILASLLLVRFEPLAPFTFATWIADWLQPEAGFAGFVVIDVWPRGETHLAPIAALGPLLATGGGLTAVAAVVFSRADV